MNTVQTVCGGVSRSEVRTVPTVRDGIKIDRSQDGTTKEEYVGRIIGGMVHHQVRFVKYEPGNGTRYELFIIPIEDIHPNDKGFLVVLDNFGRSMRARLLGTEHWGYIEEKLKVTRPSAIALAELFEYLGTQKNDHYGLDKLIDKEGTEGA